MVGGAVATGAISLVVGLSACGGGVPSGSVAQVGDAQIPTAELDRTIAQQKAAAEQQKQTFPAEGSDQYNALRRQVLEQLIFQRIIGFEAEKCGKPCRVTDAQVSADLTRIVKTNFAGDQKKFDEFLVTSNLTAADARRIVRTNLQQPKLVGRVTRGIRFTPAEALAYCTAHPLEFKKPAGREASHILVKTKAEADRIRVEVTADNFAALAQKYSTDPGSKSQGGSLGAITKGALVPEFEKVAFALGDGEISQPVRTQFGYHIITVKITAARTVPCAEAEQGIIRQQLQVKRNEATTSWRDTVMAAWKSRTTYADESLTPQSAPAPTPAPAPASSSAPTTTG